MGKQYRYKVGKKKEYLTSSVAQEKGYERLINTPRAADMADRILFPNNGTVMNNFVSGGQTGQMP